MNIIRVKENEKYLTTKNIIKVNNINKEKRNDIYHILKQIILLNKIKWYELAR